MSKDDLPALVDLTYSATTDPGRYENLIQVWERYMTQLDPGEVEDAERMHLDHFNRALEIFDQIGRRQTRRDRGDTALGLFSSPAYLIDRQGGVLQSNCSAALPDVLEAQGAADPDRAAFRAGLAELAQGAPVALVPLHDAEGRLADCLVIAPFEDQLGDPDRFIAVAGNPALNPEQLDQLARKFDFSPSEQEVYTALLAGEKVAEISARRGVGEATTRTQVRQLLDKTGSASLADLVRQGTQISAQMTAVHMARSLSGGQQADPVAYDRILTSDGRLLAYRDFGDPMGRPVLFIHNMMGGAIWPQAMTALARAEGWRIIAPSRPGFGLSDSHPSRDMELVRVTCTDMRALLDHLMVDQVLVVGMMSSAGLGIRFAKDHADRTVGLLNVAHAGLMDGAMIDAMANPARTMAKTHRKSPTALRFLIRVAVASVDVLGPEQMLRSNFKSSAPDAALMEDESVVSAIGAGLQHAIAQGGEAFSRDGFVALHDFRADAAALTRNAVCLLGQDDAMYPVDQARRLMRDLPNYGLEVFDNAGQYIFYSQFERALSLMDRMWRDGVGVGRFDTMPG